MGQSTGSIPRDYTRLAVTVVRKVREGELLRGPPGPPLVFFLAPTKPLQSYGQASPHPPYRVQIQKDVISNKNRDNQFLSKEIW
jgi:hypothetical protein